MHGHGEVVLVLEDDDSVRSLTLRLLELLGYAPLGVANRDEAVTLAQSTDRIDVLLTDVLLSGGDTGISVAREIAQARPGLTVVYMSGYTLESFIRDGTLDEGVMLLQKPFRRADLALAVHEALEFGDVNVAQTEVP